MTNDEVIEKLLVAFNLNNMSTSQFSILFTHSDGLSMSGSFYWFSREICKFVYDIDTDHLVYIIVDRQALNDVKAVNDLIGDIYDED